MNRESLLKIAVAVLSVVGIALSVYTIFIHYQVKLDPEFQPKFCHFSESVNCGPVIASKYAVFLGLPLGSYGVIFYSILLIIAALGSKYRIAGVLQLFSILACLVSVALFFISKFVIGALCPICLSMYAVNFALLVASFLLRAEPGFVKRMLNAVVSVLCAPSILVFPSSARMAAWIVAVTLIIVFGIAFALPATLANQVLMAMQVREAAPDRVDARLREWELQTPLELPPTINEGSDKDYYRGPENAQVTIVEFSDFECPSCRSFHRALNEIIADVQDQVKVVHHDFPLDAACNPAIPAGHGHQNACYAAVMARCAGEQEKFWDVFDGLFELPELDEPNDPSIVQAAALKMASELGLNSEMLESCIRAAAVKSKISADIALGAGLGLRATPTVWINGKILEGADESLLRKIIESLTQRR